MTEAEPGTPSTPSRVGWLAGVLVATAVVFVLAGAAAGLPTGYADYQWASASKLARLPVERLEALKPGPNRDLLVYIPIYLVGGLLIAAAVQRGLWRRRRLAPTAVMAALTGAAAADVVETLLFRTSLGRLLDGEGEPSIETLSVLTRAFGGIKVLAGLTAVVLLIRYVWRPGRSGMTES